MVYVRYDDVFLKIVWRGLDSVYTSNLLVSSIGFSPNLINRFLHINTVCPFSPVKKYLLIACARKQPLTLEGCHFAH